MADVSGADDRDSVNLCLRVRYPTAPLVVVSSEAGIVAVPVVDGPARVEYLVRNDFNQTPAARALLATLR